MELNDLLRIIFRENDDNHVTVEDNIMSILLYKDYIYDNEGGYITAEWDLNFDFLNEQSTSTQSIINNEILTRI